MDKANDIASEGLLIAVTGDSGRRSCADRFHINRDLDLITD
jgi:hypothetical protein